MLIQYIYEKNLKWPYHRLEYRKLRRQAFLIEFSSYFINVKFCKFYSINFLLCLCFSSRKSLFNINYIHGIIVLITNYYSDTYILYRYYLYASTKDSTYISMKIRAVHSKKG